MGLSRLAETIGPNTKKEKSWLFDFQFHLTPEKKRALSIYGRASARQSLWGGKIKDKEVLTNVTQSDILRSGGKKSARAMESAIQ